MSCVAFDGSISVAGRVANGSPRSPERSSAAQITVGRTSNRQVTGILVDFAKALEFFIDDEPSLPGVALRLAETPCSPLSKTAVSPDRATLAAFVRRTHG